MCGGKGRNFWIIFRDLGLSYPEQMSTLGEQGAFRRKILVHNMDISDPMGL